MVPKYRARLVSVDGYLDLAVVRSTPTASGAPITPSSLHLPYLHLGDVATLQLDQHVRVFGFPGRQPVQLPHGDRRGDLDVRS